MAPAATEVSVALTPSTDTAVRAPKVSVVVPVYNPGPHLARCTDSITGQTMPAEEFEAIFVDDGSTDESPARLDELAASHPNVHVIHQPNSGWPGKPRNVGIDAARGEYVFFADADDALGPEALERMHAMAVRNGSDIVVAKLVGHGRRAPRQVFVESRDRVSLSDGSLMNTLTPHKLFRRSMLTEHGLRFPEGRRRLEDEVFVVEAYFAARVISVLADYTCYYHYALDDRRTAATGQFDPGGGVPPAEYYAAVREVLSIIEAHTRPGRTRDRLLKRFARGELAGHLTGPSFLRQPRESQAAWLAEVTSVVGERIPTSVDGLLWPPQRTQMAIVRADRPDRLDLLVDLARSERDVTAVAEVRSASTAPGGGLGLEAEVELANTAGPLVFERRNFGLLLPVPESVAAAVPRSVRAIPRLVRGSTLVVLRRREDSTEVVLHPTVRQHSVKGPLGVRIRRVMRLAIQPATLERGARLRTGPWDVLVRVRIAGYNRDVLLTRPASAGSQGEIGVLHGRASTIVASWSDPDDRLTLDVRPRDPTHAPDPTRAPDRPRSRLRGRLRGRLRRLLGR